MGTLDNGSLSSTVEVQAQRLKMLHILAQLLDGTLPVSGPLQTLAQLLAAEERLDELEAAEQTGPEYQALRQAVLAYVIENPELGQTPWLRCGGAVHDMLQRLNAPGPY